MNLHSIATACADHYGVTVKMMRGRSRLQEIVLPRQVYYTLAYRLTNSPQRDIGDYLYRDVSTVSQGMNRIRAMAMGDVINAITTTVKTDWRAVSFKSSRNTTKD